MASNLILLAGIVLVVAVIFLLGLVFRWSRMSAPPPEKPPQPLAGGAPLMGAMRPRGKVATNVQVNRQTFGKIDEIPDPKIREQVRKALEQALPGLVAGGITAEGDGTSVVDVQQLGERNNPEVRQAVVQLMKSLEHSLESQDGLKGVQQTGSVQIVHAGVVYHSLDEIPDPKLRKIVAEKLKKAAGEAEAG